MRESPSSCMSATLCVGVGFSAPGRLPAAVPPGCRSTTWFSSLDYLGADVIAMRGAHTHTENPSCSRSPLI